MASVLNQSNGLRQHIKDQLERTCDKLYKDIARLEVECGSVETFEELKTFLDCCLSPLEGVLPRS